MTSKYIEEIIEKEFQRVTTMNSDASVADGAMGVALFMAWYGRKYGKTKYIEKCFYLIESRCLNLTAGDALDFHKGQVGIAMGIVWLSLSNEICTPVADVLRQVDDNIFKHVTARLNNIEKKHVGTLIDIAYYLALRLQSHSFDCIDSKIYAKLLSKIINTIYPSFYDTLFQEVFPGGYSYNLPRFIFLIANSFGNGFDNRLNHIIEELQPYVISQVPYMMSNRLALANAIYMLTRKKSIHYRWIKHVSLLVNSIDVEDFMDEYRTNQLSLYNGMSWFAFQMLILKKYGIEFNHELYNLVKMKLDYSSFVKMEHDELVARGFVGLYGILGFLFIYLNFQE